MTLQQLNQQYSIKELIPLYNYKNQERFENIIFSSFNKINQKINLKIKELKKENVFSFFIISKEELTYIQLLYKNNQSI